MERLPLPSKIPKLISNIWLSSAPSHTDNDAEPLDSADLSARMEKRAAWNSSPTPQKSRSRHFDPRHLGIPSVANSTKLSTPKATQRSRAVNLAMNTKSRSSSSAISISSPRGARRTSLIPQPEEAATTGSSPIVSEGIPSELPSEAPRIGLKTPPLQGSPRFSRRRQESLVLNPINQPSANPTHSNLPSHTRKVDRDKNRNSPPNPVNNPRSKKPRPLIGNNRNIVDSKPSMSFTGPNRIISGSGLSSALHRQQGVVERVSRATTDDLKRSPIVNQSREARLQAAGSINESNPRDADHTEGAVDPSNLLGSMTSTSSEENNNNCPTPIGHLLVVDDVGELYGAETDPTDTHQDEDSYMYHRQSRQDRVPREPLDTISVHEHVDMTASSIGDKVKEFTSLLPPSKIPRSKRNSLGVGIRLSPLAILLDEYASSLPQVSGLEPSTFRSDLLAVPGVKSRATSAAVRGESGPWEEPEWSIDQRNSTSPEQDEVLSSTLETLMESHTPLDLSNEVVIPDYRKVAHGGIATVYAGIWGDRQVAVKVLKAHKGRNVDASWEASNERRLTREIKVWAALKHSNISEFLGYTTDFSDFPAMISHWCSRGTALEYLETQDLPVDERIKLAQDVSRGLKYLHDLKIIHGDLKPSNVLVDGDCVAKLCDFGLVRLADWNGPPGMTTTSPYTGTERYKAPELFISADNRHPRATFEGDIYSLGCLMVEFIEQIYPFQRFTKTHQLRSAIMDGYSPALRSETTHALRHMTDFLWNLLEACWDELPSRPHISVIVDTLEYFAQAIPSLA